MRASGPSLVNGIPDPVRNKAQVVGARAWLESLPELVAAIECEWGLRAGHAFGDATEAYVTEATLHDGTPAVLKLLLPREGGAVAREIAVLAHTAGDPCARLLRHDLERRALLLERLGPSLHAHALPIRRRHEILCDLAARVWRPAANCNLPTGADQGHHLIERITTAWEECDRPCSEGAVAYAIACAERRIDAHDDERAVLVHGDVHQWNALRCEDGWKLVDPDGLLAEPACDLGILMREDPADLLTGDPHERSRWLAARSGLEASAIWEWGVVERVSTGLECTRIGLQPSGREMLAVADRVAAEFAQR